MSKFIYFNDLKKNKDINIKHLISYFLIIVFSIIYLFISSAKGIYLDNEFYKKTPNITNIVYTSTKNSSGFEKIILHKNINGTTTVKFDEHSITFDKEFNTTTDDFIISIDKAKDIATQQNEVKRANLILFIIGVIIFISLLYIQNKNTEIYHKIKPGFAPSEKYYILTENAPIVFCYIYLIILSLIL